MGPDGESSPWQVLVRGIYGGWAMTNSSPLPPGPPPPAWPVVPNHGTATAALVLGIIGITMVPGLGIVAWVMGHMAEKEIDAHPEVGWGNRDHAKIGKILGIVGTVIVVGIALLMIALIIVGIASSAVV